MRREGDEGVREQGNEGEKGGGGEGSDKATAGN